MAISTLEAILQQSKALSLDERLRLAAMIVENARAHYSPSAPPLRWRDLRGMAKPSLLGEDAQEWVTRTRREADEQRERALRGKQ